MSVCLSVYLCICLYVCVSVCMSVYLSVCILSGLVTTRPRHWHTSTYLLNSQRDLRCVLWLDEVWPIISHQRQVSAGSALSVCLSMCISLSLSLCVCMCVCVCVCVSVWSRHLSAELLSTCLCNCRTHMHTFVNVTSMPACVIIQSIKPKLFFF